MPSAFEECHLTWPYTIDCKTEHEAINLHLVHREITTRDGKKVTFLRSSTFRCKGPKPAPPRRSLRPPGDPFFAPFNR